MKKHGLRHQLMSYLEISNMKDIGTGNPIELTKILINCRSVTPENDGAIEQVSHWLNEIGFKSEILNFEQEGTEAILNLWSKIGCTGPTICFAGHTDVVPTGNIDEWSSDPFDASEINGKIIGRGAADMKGAIAAFISATKKFVEENPNFPGSIGFIITGDEEGCAINGTKKILKWMEENNISFDDCIVGEPTNPNTLGEMIKIGRRGSVNGVLTVEGIQGHVAYPHLADNPIPKLIKLIDNLINKNLDEGTDHFQPSNIEITSIDIGNKATNVIPRKASANFNVRYNDLFDGQKIEKEIHNRLKNLNYDYSIKFEHSGDAFLTQPGKLTQDLATIIEAQTGNKPELSTSGGTSDARFVKNYGNVVEFGLIGATMHKIDESSSIEDITNLKEIYYQALKKYFF